MKQSGLGVILLALLAPIYLSCSQLAREVDRVQPDAIEKSLLLEGEWYYRQTVTDSPFTTGYTFVGDMGKLQRGIFEIQQNILYFYRTYEFVEGSEKYAQRPDVDEPVISKDGSPVYTYQKDQFGDFKCRALKQGEQQSDPEAGTYCKAGETRIKIFRFIYKGAPVAAWPIVSHFDVRHDYNPLTGEKTNVKIENTTDKFWYQRSHMRVDWGTNSVKNYEFTMGALNDYVLMSVYEGESADPQGNDAPIFTGNYIDFTTKHFLEPASIPYEGYGTLPLCFFYPEYLGGFYECEAETLKIRHAFLKVDETDNYQPLRYDDKMMEKFGYFRTERLTYDRLRGTTYSGLIQYVNRFNVFKQWKVNQFGEPDYSQMEVKPVVYHLSQGFPRKYVAASIALVKSWNGALSETVQALTGRNDESTQNVFVLCENNVADYGKYVDANGTVKSDAVDEAGNPIVLAMTDSKYCGDMNVKKRNGDLRFNLLFMVNQPQQFGPLGYGPSSADPLSGKIINAAAYIYGGALERYGVRAMDFIDVLAGIKTDTDIKTSRDIFAEMFKKGYTVDKAQRIARNLVSEDVRLRLGKQGLTKSNMNFTQTRLGVLRQNETLDRMLLAPDLRSMFNTPRISDDQTLTKKELDKMSIANWGHKLGWRNREAFHRSMMKKTVFLESFADPAVIGLAKEFGAKYDYEVCRLVQNTGAFKLGVSYDENTNQFAYGPDQGDFTFQVANLTAPTETPDICQDLNGTTTTPTGGCTIKGLRDQLSQETLKRKTIVVNLKNNTETQVQQYENTPVDIAVSLGGQNFTSNKSLSTAKTDLAKAETDALTLGEDVKTLELRKAQLEEEVALTGDAAKQQELAQVQQELTTKQQQKANADAVVELRKLEIQAVEQQLSATPYAQLKQNLKAFSDALSLLENRKVAVESELNGLVHKARLKFRDEVRIAIYRAVTEHEVGHTLGLRHNFEASTDALNYGNQYWKLRTHCKTSQPQIGQWETPLMQKHKMRQHMYSSIMDYHAKFNSDFSGIGLYDKAAIKFGYGQLIEVFNNPPNLNSLVQTYLKEPSDADPLNTEVYDKTSDKLESVLKRVHYTQISQVLNGDWTAYDKLYERTNIRVRDFDPTKGHVEVPYRFCSDDYVGVTPTCQRYDEGADPFEIVANLASDYENYYIFWAFKRDQVIFESGNYFNRILSNFFNMQSHFQVWAANYARYNKNDWWQSQYGKRWEEDPNGGLSGSLAAYISLNTMVGALTRPVPGTYFQNQKTGVFEFRKTGQTYGGSVSLAEIDGARDMYNDYNYDGYIYKTIQIGSFYDRYAAMLALTDPSTFFYGVDDSADSRRFLINYQTMFPKQVLNIFGGLVADDYKGFGWRVKKEGSTTTMLPTVIIGDPTDVQNSLTLPAVNPNANYLFPTTKYRVPAMAALYGMSLLVSDFNNAFTDQSRVWIKGNGQAPEIDPTAQTIEYTDCLSGRTYVAAKYGDNDVFSPGFSLIQQAKDNFAFFGSCDAYKKAYNGSELQFVIGKLEILRGFLDLYDY